MLFVLRKFLDHFNFRKPQEDTEIGDQPVLPNLPRIPGLKLTGTGFADLLMVFEFLHNFGETLGFSESTGKFHLKLNESQSLN